MAKSLEGIRLERYMTVKDFADLLEISEDLYYRIMRGHVPRMGTINKVARQLRIHPSDISEFSAKRLIEKREDKGDA